VSAGALQIAEERLAAIRAGRHDALADLDARLEELVAQTTSRAELEAVLTQVRVADALLRDQLAHTASRLREEPARRHALRGYAATLAR
jgi:DNA repair exonuclease SbcCD ATPase subunit